MQSQKPSATMLLAALKLARNMWREARLVCASAPPWMVEKVVNEQAMLRRRALKQGVGTEELGGAIYSVVLTQAVHAVNECPTATALCRFFRAAEVLEKRHGFRVQFVLDAVAEQVLN